MARPKSLNPSESLHIHLDAALLARLTILLYSEVEQRVPKGEWQRFFEARIREYLDWRQQDLAPYGFPTGYYITGPAEMTEAVIERLKGA